MTHIYETKTQTNQTKECFKNSSYNTELKIMTDLKYCDNLPSEGITMTTDWTAAVAHMAEQRT